MKQTCAPGMGMAKVRRLAESFTAAELNRCLDAQIDTQANACMACLNNAQALDLLARAAYVRHKVETGGDTVNGAMRELGRRMRRLLQGTQ